MSLASSRWPWRPHSVAGKLLAAQIAVLALIALFVFVYYPIQQERATIAGTEQRAKSLARMVALGVAISLESDDYAAITEAFEWAQADSDLSHISVVDEAGSIFARYDPKGLAGDSLALASLGEVAVVAGILNVRVPVTYGDQILGSLIVGISLEAMHDRIDRDRRYALLIALGVLLVGSWLTLLSARRITGPLVALTDAAGEVASGNLDVGVEITSGDEVGELSAAFAGMVAEVREARRRQRLESAVRLRRLANAASEAIVISDGGEIVDVNAAFVRTFERDLVDVLGAPTVSLFAHSEEGVGDGGVPPEGGSARSLGVKSGGETFPIEVHARHLPSEGSDLSVLAIRDLSEEVRAREALEVSESRLRQAQKMEAVGQLAGGVAHDFNNLLTAIRGYAELLLAEQNVEEEVRDDLMQIRSAADRAADLTGQLLAFSRKQVLRPRILDLNATLDGLRKMLQRLIREDVQVVTETYPGLHMVAADPGQLDQVILNLAVNARDAMPDGGILTIEVKNVDRPNGDPFTDSEPVEEGWVALSVSDTGCGMDEQTRNKVFEPFFTTKEAGKGTGLGLATVHGIVSQSGGTISVHSEVGVGSRFTVYLKAVEDVAEGAPDEVGYDETSRGSETILLVEDEATVRVLARRMLERAGYHVLEASTPQHGVELAADHDGPIDVLLTDVLMPGTNGPKVAEAVRAHRPEVQVVFMSGHADEFIGHHGVFDADNHFVQKPFSATDLTGSIRGALETTRKGRATGVAS